MNSKNFFYSVLCIVPVLAAGILFHYEDSRQQQVKLPPAPIKSQQSPAKIVDVNHQIMPKQYLENEAEPGLVDDNTGQDRQVEKLPYGANFEANMERLHDEKYDIDSSKDNNGQLASEGPGEDLITDEKIIADINQNLFGLRALQNK